MKYFFQYYMYPLKYVGIYSLYQNMFKSGHLKLSEYFSADVACLLQLLFLYKCLQCNILESFSILIKIILYDYVYFQAVWTFKMKPLTTLR